MFFEGLLTGISIMLAVAFLVSNIPIKVQRVIFKYRPLMDIVLSVSVIYLALGSSASMLLGSVIAGLGLSVYVKIMHKVLHYARYDSHNIITKYIYKIYKRRFGDELNRTTEVKKEFNWFGWLKKSRA